MWNLVPKVDGARRKSSTRNTLASFLYSNDDNPRQRNSRKRNASSSNVEEDDIRSFKRGRFLLPPGACHTKASLREGLQITPPVTQ